MITCMILSMFLSKDDTEIRSFEYSSLSVILGGVFQRLSRRPWFIFSNMMLQKRNNLARHDRLKIIPFFLYLTSAQSSNLSLLPPVEETKVPSRIHGLWVREVSFPIPTKKSFVKTEQKSQFNTSPPS